MAWFSENVHIPFLADTATMMIAAYRDAYDECRSRPREVARDLRGHLRRALIEERWPIVAQRFADEGITVRYRPNHTRTSFYAELRFGRVILTQSYVESPETIIRRAEYRSTLARPNQPDLFCENPPPLPTDPLYAILIHGEDSKQHNPYFADIVFPDQKCQEYLGRVKLFDLCWSSIEPLLQTTSQEEVIPDEATPELLPQENEEA